MVKKRLKADDFGATRWQGCLQGMVGQLLYGWAVDSSDPDARVVLQILFNGEAVCPVVADVARHDVAGLGQCADICHGFVFDIGTMRGQGHFTVCVANTGFLLAGQVALDQTVSPPRTASNLVFNDGGLRLLGFALDPLDSQRLMRVRAFWGEQQLAEVIADQELPALRSYQIGGHGFLLDLPVTLADGQTHSIRVVDDNGFPLAGSPLPVCCHVDGADVLLQEMGASPLLQNVFRGYQRYLPRSAGWDSYAAWAQQFAARPVASQALPAVALVLTGFDHGLPAHAPLWQPQVGLDCRVFPAVERAPDGSVRVVSGARADFPALLREALETGVQWLACVRACDSLPPHALACALAEAAQPDVEIIYTDSETLQEGVLRPWFKPAWNPEYALATDYALELMLVKTAAIREWLQQHPCPPDAPSLAWAMLQSVWPRASRAVLHVPHVLYRFQTPFGSAEQAQRLQAARCALAALEPHAVLLPLAMVSDPGCAARRLQRLQPWSFAAGAQPGSAMAAENPDAVVVAPRVTLIIPTRDQQPLLQRCIDSLLQYTGWPDLEIMVVDNDSVEPGTHVYFSELQKRGIKVLHAPGEFNFARINNLAVREASGEVIGLINNDIEAMHENWLQELLSHLMQPGVGAVGAKLLWPNRMVQHAGIVLGIGNVAGHYGNLWHDSDPGDHARNQVVMQVSGVTAACLLMHKAVYLAMGGMDEVAFPVAFNDVDLCLRLRQAGLAIIWSPFARLLHAESVSRGREDTPQKQARAQREIEHLRQRWGRILLNDPAYHPSLNLDAHAHPFTGLALPPRRRSARRAGLVSDEGQS